MKAAIRYFTKSKKGNTRKLAEAVSKALGLEALEVSADLSERVDKLFLINAMYAANIDKEVTQFLARNKEKIGEIINMNTSATGASTLKAVKSVAEGLKIPVNEKAFACKASWIFINQGLPSAEDFARAADFAKQAAGEK